MRLSILAGGLMVIAVAGCGAEREPAVDVEVTEGAATAPLSVAQVLNGQMLLSPCRVDTQAAVCTTVLPLAGCPAANPGDRALSGVHTTDRTLTLGGVPGRRYTITLHIQGEVESKRYVEGATDAEQMLTSPRANGFASNGVPANTDGYNVYMIRVTNPGSAVSTSYYLNSLEPPGASNHTTYGVDYVAEIQARGGATIRLVASDPNCSQIKNCGPIVNNGTVCAAPIILANVDPVARAQNPSFNFDTPYNGQWLSMVVTRVTTP